LGSLGDQEYRQILLKPYRLIYRVVRQQVVIYLVSDGRRDMQSLYWHADSSAADDGD